jgi:hypothetical protein
MSDEGLGQSRCPGTVGAERRGRGLGHGCVQQRGPGSEQLLPHRCCIRGKVHLHLRRERVRGAGPGLRR